jgi:hypothetical protein
MFNKNTDVDTVVDLAKKAVKNVLAGEIFTLRDLFPAIEWKRLPLKTRIQIGSKFFDDFNNGKIPDIEECGKTAQRQQCYRKKVTSVGDADEETQAF